MKWHVVWIGCIALAGCDSVVVEGSGSGSSSTSDSSTSETSPTGITTAPMTSSTSDTSPTTGPSSSSSTGIPDTASGGTSSGTSSGPGGSSSSGSGSSGSTGAESSSSTGFEGSTSSTSTTGINFIDPTETGPAVECDSYQQDCPEGEKCNPWSNNGSGAWNALGCFPVDPTPGQIGETCQVEGSGTSGVDTCELAAMCWNVNMETNEGTCIGLCEGSAATPTCADPTATCVIQNGGILNLCLASCDPLLQECLGNEACYPVDEGFVCAPDASGVDAGAQGDLCEFINACDAGLNCLNADAYGPGCVGAGGCCSAFCDINDIDPCSAGQECLPWYEEGMAPMGLEDVGVCSVPA